MAIYAIGDRRPTIHPEAFVHPEATVIGAVTIGADSSIWPSAVLRGDYGAIVIGERTSIQDGAVIHATAERSTIVGDGCVVGHLAHLECCTIHDGSLVGSGSIVLHRAEIGPGALVGAGAVVPNDMVVPTGSMALGVPARLRPDSVDPATVADGAPSYVENARWFRAELRRLDG